MRTVIYLVLFIYLLNWQSWPQLKSQLFTHFLHIFQDLVPGWDYWNSEAQTLLREALPRATAEELWGLQTNLPHWNGKEDCLHLQDKQRGPLGRLLVKWNMIKERFLSVDWLRRMPAKWEKWTKSTQCHHHVWMKSDFHVFTCSVERRLMFFYVILFVLEEKYSHLVIWTFYCLSTSS